MSWEICQRFQSHRGGVAPPHVAPKTVDSSSVSEKPCPWPVFEGPRCGKAEEASGKKDLATMRRFAEHNQGMPGSSRVLREKISVRKSSRGTGPKMCPVGYTSVNMSQEPEPRLENQEDSQGHPASKKPYQKPAFRYERVFETMALACGKGLATAVCKHNKKTS
jgi:hypothetical protein